jgi:hypothetical protein
MLQMPVLATQDRAQERRHVFNAAFGARSGTLGPEKITVLGKSSWEKDRRRKIVGERS